MACPTCGLSVLFGGVKDGDKRYCSKDCYKLGAVERYSETIPQGILIESVHKIRNGNCPGCGAKSTVDIHQSFSIYSILIYTSYKTHDHMVCKRCAVKHQLVHLTSSLLFGWWGVPYGFIVTPIQIIKNIVGLFKNPGRREATELMQKKVAQLLAAHSLSEQSGDRFDY